MSGSTFTALVRDFAKEMSIDDVSKKTLLPQSLLKPQAKSSNMTSLSQTVTSIGPFI